MPLSPGERLGPYQVVSLLGEGGMGEVYRARDTRLDRTVALKVAKRQFSERFEREARAIAALNHPHICTLYDVGPSYLVIEYVEGEPLDAALRKGPIPLARALTIGIDITEALAAAHRQGIVHRDLKPANIVLAKSGPKLLDFGLAKTFAPTSAEGDLTTTAAVTQEGSIVGTLQYMAPEQLESKDADARSDIFALGCVLYEMVSGKPAFTGRSAASLISAIMTSQPAPLMTVSPTAPRSLDRLIRRCLAKDPDARWQCAADLAVELRDIAATSPQEEPAPARQFARVTPMRAAMLVTATVVAFAVGWWWPRSQPIAGWSGVMLGGPSMAMGPRASPDGRLVAFDALVDGMSQVAVMKPETGNWTVLTHARNGGLVDKVAWSADGSRIYFDRILDSPQGVFSVPLLGGDEKRLLDGAGDPEVLPDGSLLVLRINSARLLQLYHFWPDSGKLEPLPDLRSSYVTGGTVRVFPDGKEVVFYGSPTPDGEAHLYALDLATNHTRRLAPGLVLRPVMGPRFPVAVTQDGRSVIVDVRSGNLNRITSVPRDGSGGESVLFTTTAAPWYIDTSPDGSLYMDQMDRPVDILRFPITGGVPERIAGSFQESMRGIVPIPGGGLLMAGPAGERESLLLVQPGHDSTPLLDTTDQTEPPVALAGPDQVVLTLRNEKETEIAVASLSARRILRRVPVPHRTLRSVAVSPDGRVAYFAADRNIWSVSFDGGKPRRVCSGDAFAMYPGGEAILVQLVENDRTRLQRVRLNGGPSEEIPMGASAISSEPLAPNSIASDGRIAVSVAPPDSWFYEPGVLDATTGIVTRIPVQQTADYFVVGWDGNGRIVSMAMEARCAIWRFMPQARAR